MKQTILMIDDDIDDINLTKEAFEMVNADVKFSYLLNAEEIESYLILRSGKDNIRLILLDLNMPVVNGKAILKHLKTNPNYASIPVVVFTTSYADSEREECLKLGANTFITKPTESKHWQSFVKALCFLYLKNCLSNQD
jgi:CheY-like chemotaxis protein